MLNKEVGKLQTIDGKPHYLTFKNNFINLFKSESIPLITEIETVADDNKSLNNKYFIISTPFEKYCVYFNVDNSSVGPQVASFFSLIEVSISENSNADTVASAIKTQLDSTHSEMFTTERTNNLLTITNVKSGEAYNYSSIDGNTGFTITVIQKGKDAFSIVKSEIPEESLYEILDASINNSGDLTVLGIYKISNKKINEFNLPVWNEEFFKDSKTYSSWVSLI